MRGKLKIRRLTQESTECGIFLVKKFPLRQESPIQGETLLRVNTVLARVDVWLESGWTLLVGHQESAPHHTYGHKKLIKEAARVLFR